MKLSCFKIINKYKNYESFSRQRRTLVRGIFNPNFALEGVSDVLVLGSGGARGKHRRTRRVHRGFTLVSMLPMTSTDDVSANTNFGFKELCFLKRRF